MPSLLSKASFPSRIRMTGCYEPGEICHLHNKDKRSLSYRIMIQRQSEGSVSIGNLKWNLTFLMGLSLHNLIFCIAVFTSNTTWVNLKAQKGIVAYLGDRLDAHYVLEFFSHKAAGASPTHIPPEPHCWGKVCGGKRIPKASGDGAQTAGSPGFLHGKSQGLAGDVVRLYILLSYFFT